jgi:hypothetical protein
MMPFRLGLKWLAEVRCALATQKLAFGERNDVFGQRYERLVCAAEEFAGKSFRQD